ncbi:MAG: hypothetical protein ACLU9X_01265 [Alistipes shahii]
MKLITRFLYLSAAGIMLLTSCAKEQTESYDKFENQALEAWMTQNRRELLKNYQPEGGYYVEILAAGNPDAKPVNDTACWVKFDFSGRDLSGNIVLTRRANEARQLGTFTKYTHYVPFYRYCGTENTSLMEGTFLAMRNTLHLDPDYAAGKGVDPRVPLREGCQVRLYMPSRIVGGGVAGDGGYEGAVRLERQRPLIVDDGDLRYGEEPAGGRRLLGGRLLRGQRRNGDVHQGRRGRFGETPDRSRGCETSLQPLPSGG